MIVRMVGTWSCVLVLAFACGTLALPLAEHPAVRIRRQASSGVRTRRSEHPDIKLLRSIWKLQHSINYISNDAIEAKRLFCEMNSAACSPYINPHVFHKPSVAISIEQTETTTKEDLVREFYLQLFPILDRYRDAALTISTLETMLMCNSGSSCSSRMCSGEGHKGSWSFYCHIDHHLSHSLNFSVLHLMNWLRKRDINKSMNVEFGTMSRLKTATNRLEFKHSVLLSLVEDSRTIHEELWKLYALVRTMYIQERTNE